MIIEKSKNLKSQIKLHENDVLYLEKDIDEPAPLLSCLKTPKGVAFSLRPEEEDFHHEKYLFNDASHKLNIAQNIKSVGVPVPDKRTTVKKAMNFQ